MNVPGWLWIGKLRLKLHRLANTRALQLKLAELELHRIAIRVPGQNVQKRSVSGNAIDNEVRQALVLLGLSVALAGSFGFRCNGNHQPVEFQRVHVYRAAQQFPRVRLSYEVLDCDE